MVTKPVNAPSCSATTMRAFGTSSLSQRSRHQTSRAAKSIEATRAAKIFLNVERVELYRRIEARFDAMLASGAIEEVRALAERNLDPSLPAMKAHGVPWLIRHFRGEIALAEASEGGKRDTRRYTKRQGTWFRNQLPDFRWMTPAEAGQASMDAAPSPRRPREGGDP